MSSKAPQLPMGAKPTPPFPPPLPHETGEEYHRRTGAVILNADGSWTGFTKVTITLTARNPDTDHADEICHAEVLR
jgi:di/tripeptidase